MKCTYMMRNIFGDTIKGVAILLVVLGHSIQYGGGDSYLFGLLYLDNFLFKAICSFHMPLFMLISGFYFSKTLKRKSTKEIIVSKLHTLLLPILSFSLIKIFVVSFGESEFYISFKQCINLLLDNLWFLWALLICSFICLAIEHKKLHLMTYVCIVIASTIIPPVFKLTYVSFLLPFFVIGLKAEQRGWTSLVFRQWVGYICTFAFVVLLLFYTKDSYIYTSGSYIGGTAGLRQFITDLYRWLIGFCGSVSVIFILHLFAGNGSAALGKIGVLSLGIYCWQDTIIRVWLHLTRAYAYPGLVWWGLSFLILLVGPICLTFLTSWLSIFRKLLYGGRKFEIRCR